MIKSERENNNVQELEVEIPERQPDEKCEKQSVGTDRRLGLLEGTQ